MLSGRAANRGEVVNMSLVCGYWIYPGDLIVIDMCLNRNPMPHFFQIFMPSLPLPYALVLRSSIVLYNFQWLSSPWDKNNDYILLATNSTVYPPVHIFYIEWRLRLMNLL